MKTITEILHGEMENHIAPFLWIHGETEDKIKQEIERIYESGIRALCVEARPHNDFNGSGWFHDLKVILRTCKKLGMKMWILDDSHFPTGYANGEVKKRYPQLCKKFLCSKMLDFCGPVKNTGAILKYAFRSEKDQLIGVWLCKKTEFQTIDPGNFMDLTDQVEWIPDRSTDSGKESDSESRCPIVNFDLPEGEWTLVTLTVSYKGGEKRTEGYLNPIVPEATKVLLDTVYQPIFDRFGEEFGNTILGFFSDEPRFGNYHGSEEAGIGQNVFMDLPWCDGLEGLLEEKLRNTSLERKAMRELFPLLFLKSKTEEAHIVQYVYMDLISQMYSEHFDGVIAEWCEEHHCQHIGHTIEDNNAVSRMGYGAGHFFRAMKHQDMAGIDVVIHQLIPGMDKGMFFGMHKPGWDGEFFTYMLGKIGTSLAELNPKMQGRCMCELFGAYGWAEGNRLCKWLADYMLVRGVNYFVPHAFNPAAFPDRDCPPHFYAQGHNPQYENFSILMEYMNRMAEILSGGKHIVPVAVLFHAEAEWSGDYMLTQKPTAELAKHLIDYTIVPADYLAVSSSVNGRLKIQEQDYKALVIPFSEALPKKVIDKVQEYIYDGGKVYFIEKKPERTCEGEKAEISGGMTISLENLSTKIQKDGIAELCVEKNAPALRYYHTYKEKKHIFFFTNEGTEEVSTYISGFPKGENYSYDAFKNKLTRQENVEQMVLSPYMSKCIIIAEDEELEKVSEMEKTENVISEKINLLNPQISLTDSDNLNTKHRKKLDIHEFCPLNRLPEMQDFSGAVQYDIAVMLDGQQKDREAVICINGVSEGASVEVNGTECGRCICPPYEYEISDKLREGANSITIRVDTTPGRRYKDFLSQYLLMEPIGITGGVQLILK